MPIKIRCACGNVLLAPEDRVGETGKCPNCNRSIKVEMPRSSDTKKLLPHPENEKEESKHFILKRKPSWIRRILAFPVYAIFLLLVSFIVSIHSFSEVEIQTLCQKYIPDEIWAMDQIFFVRESHRNFFLTQIYQPLALYYKKFYPDAPASQGENKKKESAEQSIPEKKESPLKPETPTEAKEKQTDASNQPEIPVEPKSPEKE